MLYCRFCGSELPDDARFCGGCGSAVRVAEEGVTHLGSSPERGMLAPDAPTFISHLLLLLYILHYPLSMAPCRLPNLLNRQSI